MNSKVSGSQDYMALRQELRDFHGINGARKCINPRRIEQTQERKTILEDYYRQHPQADTYELRQLVYEMISSGFEPILFKESPFYFEIGGNGGWNESGVGRCIRHLLVWPFLRTCKKEHSLFSERRKADFYSYSGGTFVDVAHNCAPIHNILKRGFRGFYEDAIAALQKNLADHERKFVECAVKGLEAVKVIMDKYAAAAAERAADPTLEPRQKKFMQMIAEAAQSSPWNPPRNYYEGLNTCWFVREFVGELDGLCVNSLGRPDAWLIDLYRQDIKNGVLTEADAYDLTARFLLHADGVYDHDYEVREFNEQRTTYDNAHENECTITLGGCDEDGNEVFNELTRLFMRIHRDEKMIYPKPQHRFSENSSDEYLRLLAEDLLSGRNVYSLLNDDSLIPALMLDGKRSADARNYCCTGCFDIVVDSCEDNSGGTYFNLAKILEAVIYHPEKLLQDLQYDFARLDDAPDFETVYTRVMNAARMVLQQMLSDMGNYGKYYSQISAAPLDSACSSDCLLKLRDFTAGGQRYNPHAVSLCFWANFIDSLLSIQTLCFEQKICTLPELLQAVRNNWQDQESLRKKVLQCPHWGDDKPETTQLARRVFDDLYNDLRLYRNEHGGSYQLGFWCYREFRYWGEKTAALPDGRYTGDALAQSLNPSHFRNREALTTVLQSLSRLDMQKCAGNSVINMVLDRSSSSPETVIALLKSFANLKLQLLQLNCLGREELLEAQNNPDDYADLIVRVCGFSAKFTALSQEWQQEVIDRTSY